MILNKQKKVRLATRPLQEFLRKTQRELNIAGSEITVAFVTDAEITRWNERYRRKEGPTDVLSFPATYGAPRNHPVSTNGSAPPRSSSRAPLARRATRLLAEVLAKAGDSPSVYAESRRPTRSPRPGQAHSPVVYPKPRGTTRLPGAHSLALRGGPLFLGDIAIAPETAKRYAKKHGRSLAAEIRVLMLHGVLHLMGYDHESDTGQMNRIEQKLRRKLGIA